MTIGDYIQAKLKRFHFSMSTDELEALLVDYDLQPTDTYSKPHAIVIKKAMVSIIPELLLAPDISQGSFSIKRNIEGIKAFYSLLCSETGLPDIYAESQPTIEDKSYLW